MRAPLWIYPPRAGLVTKWLLRSPAYNVGKRVQREVLLPCLVIVWPELLSCLYLAGDFTLLAGAGVDVNKRTKSVQFCTDREPGSRIAKWEANRAARSTLCRGTKSASCGVSALQGKIAFKRMRGNLLSNEYLD